jgi:transcriptional regulator with XRE-family HTH domain
MTTPARIRELRRRLGLDEKDLALRSGLSVDTIRQIEEGNMQPSAITLRSLAGALGTTAAELAKPDEW